MKRFLLWTFDRGSLQYDVMCGLILAFLFLIPRGWFTDVPPYMKVSSDQAILKTLDRNGNAIFTIRLDQPVFFDQDDTRHHAEQALAAAIKKPITVSRIQPVRDWTGRVNAYAIWIER